MLSRPLHAVRPVRAALLVGLVLAGPAASADGPSTAKVGKKIDNLQIMRKRVAALGKFSRHFERCGEPGNAVKPPAARYRVGMRADHDRSLAGLSPCEATDQIASRVQPDIKSGLREALRQISPAVGKHGCE